MEISYLGRTVNLDNLKTHADIVNFLENIEPTETIDLAGNKVAKPPEQHYYLIDTMTNKEKALVSFLYALNKYKDTILKKLSPLNASDILSAIMTGELPKSDTKFPINDYIQYNRLYHMYGVCKRYFDFIMHDRVGFDTFLEYDMDGNIYTASDLRGTLC